MNPIKILIADDHTLIADMWGALLSRESRYQVVDKVNSCSQLTDAVMQLQPDIVLLDIILSDGSSLDMLPLLKAKVPATKFLVVTGYLDKAMFRKSFAAGADGYLTKTSNLEEMNEAIEVLMQGGKYRCKEMDHVNDFLIEGGSETSEAPKLTKKEKQVAYWVYKGLSAKDIAEKLGVSFKTVEVHRHHIYQKLGIQKASKLMLYVQDNPQFFQDVMIE